MALYIDREENLYFSSFRSSTRIDGEAAGGFLLLRVNDVNQLSAFFRASLVISAMSLLFLLGIILLEIEKSSALVLAIFAPAFLPIIHFLAFLPGKAPRLRLTAVRDCHLVLTAPLASRDFHVSYALCCAANAIASAYALTLLSSGSGTTSFIFGSLAVFWAVNLFWNLRCLVMVARTRDDGRKA